MRIVILLLMIPSLSYAQDVDIIDGGDVRTLNALFPGVCEDGCPGLERMRAQRLANEAKQRKERGYSFLHLSFGYDARALDELFDQKEVMIEEKLRPCLARLDKTMYEFSAENETVSQKRNLYSLRLTSVYKYYGEFKEIENLREYEQCQHVNIYTN